MKFNIILATLVVLAAFQTVESRNLVQPRDLLEDVYRYITSITGSLRETSIALGKFGEKRDVALDNITATYKAANEFIAEIGKPYVPVLADYEKRAAEQGVSIAECFSYINDIGRMTKFETAEVEVRSRQVLNEYYDTLAPAMRSEMSRITPEFDQLKVETHECDGGDACLSEVLSKITLMDHLVTLYYKETLNMCIKIAMMGDKIFMRIDEAVQKYIDLTFRPDNPVAAFPVFRQCADAKLV